MKTRIFVPGLILLLALTGGRAAGPVKPASLSTGSASASVRGVVKLEGTVPKGKPISMAADPSCAKLHSAPMLSQDVVADAKGGLQNVIIFVADGLADRAYDPPSEPAVIEQKGCMYQPHVIAMRANQNLEVFKQPYFVMTGKDGSFDLNNLPPGTYTLKAWHEKLGTAAQQITIGASETKTVEFVFKLKPGV